MKIKMRMKGERQPPINFKRGETASLARLLACLTIYVTRFEPRNAGVVRYLMYWTCFSRLSVLVRSSSYGLSLISSHLIPFHIHPMS